MLRYIGVEKSAEKIHMQRRTLQICLPRSLYERFQLR